MMKNNPIKKWSIGVDVGGTEIKFGLFEDQLIEKWSIPTNRSDQGGHILPEIAEEIHRCCMRAGVLPKRLKGIGIGVPGPVVDGLEVRNCVNLGWGAVKVAEILTKSLLEFSEWTREDIYVQCANDANVAALGELWLGGGRGCKDLVMVTLGTGVGAGIVIDGRILNGSGGCAGEIGHMPCLDETDIVGQCNCGNRGCLEQMASATGIVAYTKRELKKTPVKTLLRAVTADALNAEIIFNAGKAGDVFADGIAEKVAFYLGRGLASACTIVNPEKILIGGGVSAAGEYLREKVEKYFREQVFHGLKNTPVGLAELGNDAGIAGAAYMVISAGK